MSATPRQLCEHMFLLVDRFKLEVTTLAEANGLTRMQAFVLFSLHRQGDECQGMGKIAEAMHCDASNITGIVDRLVSGGFVIRTENERDRRAKLLVLTPKGETVVDAVLEALPERIGGNLSSDERDQLVALLQKACA
jgi:DNA-binding MarR family transcriptional regulator